MLSLNPNVLVFWGADLWFGLGMEKSGGTLCDSFGEGGGKEQYTDKGKV